MKGAPGDPARRRRLPSGGFGLLAGLVTFAVIAVVLTDVLDPLLWPSLLVSLPIGAIAGAATAILVYRFLRRDPTSGRKWGAIWLTVIALAVVFALALAGLSLVGEQRVDETYESAYEYRVTIAPDETLENVTLYVPVPVEGNGTRLGNLFVETVRYDRYVPAMRGTDPDPHPVNFTYRLFETEHGPMVAISAERIAVRDYYYREVENETMGYRERISAEEYDPDDPSMGVQNDGSFTFTVSLTANESIETADPFGTEPLLSARHNRTEVECFTRHFETQHCYDYDGRVYADYDTDRETTVYIGTELAGRNEWFSGGWRGNEYREWSRTELLGPQSGWYVTDGEVEVGVGTYRDSPAAALPLETRSANEN